MRREHQRRQEPNRVQHTVNGVTASTFCYDNADRLTTTNPNGGATVTFTYDTHGNTSAIDSQTMTYDVDNRHLSTTASSTTIRYVRDATDAIVERKKNGTTTARMSGNCVLDASNNVVARAIGLPGGVTLTKFTSSDTWTYPNTGRHAAAEANSSGVKVGATNTYDPFGNLVSGQTIVNRTTDFNLGWSPQPTETESSLFLPRIEMGARQYLPWSGRFLSVDPVDGGSASNYGYASGDPTGQSGLLR